MAKKFVILLNYNTVIMVILILLSALGIFIICGTIEYLRIRLFKILQIDKLEEKISNFWSTKINIIK